MRLTIDYEMSGDKIPKDYRRGFASLIKNAIENCNPKLYEYYYTGEFKMKPFTFGIYFPQGTKKNGDGFYVGNQFKLNFSTSSIELATHIYNGFHRLKIDGYPLFDNIAKPTRSFLHRNFVVRRNEILFKTISPVLVITKGSNIKEYPKYLLPGEEGFEEGLEFSVRECAKEFLETNNDFEFEVEVKTFKKITLWHYNQWMSSFNGIIEIKSPPEVLQMIYDIGLGVRRSQGFGMLEVVG